MFDLVILLILLLVVYFAIWLLFIKQRRRRVLWSILLLVIVVALSAIGTYRLSKSRTVQAFGHLINKGITEEKIVALTFDDGPYPGTTDEVLEILKEHDIKATFFVIGKDVEANPDETTAIIDAGHELGNHSYSHPRMMFASYENIEEEMAGTDQALRELGYEPTKYVRSPYCKKLFAFPWYLSRNDLINVTWTIEPETFVKEKDALVEYTVSNIEPGAIILLHPLPSARETTREALEEIIIEVKAMGYTFVTVSEMLEN